MAYGTIAAFNGALITPWNSYRDLPDVESPKAGPTVVLKQTELPDVDVTRLNAEQKAAWTEARDRFRNVAPRVYGARVLLNELSGRLQGQGMSLHPEDAANAPKMQRFLEDAAALMREVRFATAAEALRRAASLRVQRR